MVMHHALHSQFFYILLYYQVCSIHRLRHLHRCPSPSILAVFVAYRAQSPSFHYRSIQRQFRVSSPMAADDDVDPIRFNRRWIPRPRGPHLHLRRAFTREGKNSTLKWSRVVSLTSKLLGYIICTKCIINIFDFNESKILF